MRKPWWAAATARDVPAQVAAALSGRSGGGESAVGGLVGPGERLLVHASVIGTASSTRPSVLLSWYSRRVAVSSASP